jgi:hypothetical protein
LTRRTSAVISGIFAGGLRAAGVVGVLNFTTGLLITALLFAAGLAVLGESYDLKSSPSVPFESAIF